MSGTPGWWSDDERLLAELAAAVREAEVPESQLGAGKAAYAWRSADVELAELRSDSRLGAEASGFRAEPSGVEHRALSFVAGELAIEVEIHPDAIRGQIAPAQPGTMLVRDENGPVITVPVDDLGWFVIRPVPAGRFRLHVRTSAGAAVLTDWISGRS